MAYWCRKIVFYSGSGSGMGPPAGIDIDLSLTHWSLGDLGVILKMKIFNPVLLIGIFRTSEENALRWMPQDVTYDRSILVQVMAWCRQATSHYLSQCWPRSLSPYDVTRPKWANMTEWKNPTKHEYLTNVLYCYIAANYVEPHYLRCNREVILFVFHFAVRK